MNKKILLVAILVGAALSQGLSQTVFTIEDIINRALEQSPQSKQNETQTEISYWQFRNYRSTTFGPQLVLRGSVPSYTNGITPVANPTDGSINYVSVNQVNPNVSLSLEQPILWTGGTLSANSSQRFFSKIGDPDNNRTVNAFTIGLDQPIFSFNPLKWNNRIQPIVYEESKRSYIEQKEFISRRAGQLFFTVLTAQVNLQIAQYNKANNDTVYQIELGRYNIGTTGRGELLQVQLQALRSEGQVTQANLDLQNARLNLRNYISLNEGAEYQLVLPNGIPEFEVTIDEALKYAKLNRADYIAFERRRIEAERNVAQAKGQRYQTSLSASYGLNDSSSPSDDINTPASVQQGFNLGLNIPILTGGRNRTRMRTAELNKQLQDYVIAQDEITFEQEIITLVRQFETLRLAIEITNKSDEVAQERYTVAQNRYLIGKVDITNLNIALTEKDDARRGYIQALQNFWLAYYDLRRLTLYDFQGGTLLYTSED